ncbi:hypothetical protein QBC40DRAFT_294002 [Triangularia verruculosa]|uniref:Uncharacterized protein n=1 Tax=Triangularia verruculosa TaxID=2587418 RepID=A0AAN6XN11_9PEZI|nr:hypothetical protein QBC40DRAFT_294002 [Triangularia verruculosa]
MPSKYCINPACNAIIDQEDKTCPRCRTKQSRKRSPEDSTSPPIRTKPAPASHGPSGFSGGGGGGGVATASMLTAAHEGFVPPNLNYSAKAPRPKHKSRAGTRAPSTKPSSSSDKNKNKPSSSDKPAGERWSPLRDAIDTEEKNKAAETKKAVAEAEEKNKSKLPAVTDSMASLSMAATVAAAAATVGYQPAHYQSSQPPVQDYRQPPPQGYQHQPNRGYPQGYQPPLPEQRQQTDSETTAAEVLASRFAPPESRGQSPAPRGTPPGPGAEGSGGKKK